MMALGIIAICFYCIYNIYSQSSGNDMFEYVNNCLYMCCCGPCAVADEETDSSNKCSSPLCCSFVLLPDVFGLVSNGIYLGQKKGTHPSKITCYELCCTPCYYADNKKKEKEEQEQLNLKSNEMPSNSSNSSNSSAPRTAQPVALSF